MSAETTASADEFAWAPRRQLTLAQARRRSDIVRLLRMVFVACAAISIGLLVGHVVRNAVAGLSGERKAFHSNEIVTMINPRFTGRDNGGQAYVITADSAQRQRANENIVDLVNPKLVDDMGSEVTAPEGVYHRSTGILDLYRDVRVADSAGYRFRTTEARYFMNESRIIGLEPLRGKGPVGDIRSDSYEILEDGDVVNFEGNVEITFVPEETRAESTDTPPLPTENGVDEDTDLNEG
jgi:lipopolysaccharide export system protein LptC